MIDVFCENVYLFMAQELIFFSFIFSLYGFTL